MISRASVHEAHEIRHSLICFIINLIGKFFFPLILLSTTFALFSRKYFIVIFGFLHRISSTSSNTHVAVILIRSRYDRLVYYYPILQSRFAIWFGLSYHEHSPVDEQDIGLNSGRTILRKKGLTGPVCWKWKWKMGSIEI